MLNGIIRFALNNRLPIICLLLVVMVAGSYIGSTLPVDVLPKLTRPRVAVITECNHSLRLVLEKSTEYVVPVVSDGHFVVEGNDLWVDTSD